ncbi:MAG: ribosome biogenesis GTP-binding protein YihA/YsxC [Myxococcota bacterium]
MNRKRPKAARSQARVTTAELLTSAASVSGFPAPGPPEIAFLGRSNVGKSSLLNALVGRRALARTSGTPGKTRLLNWFRVVRGGRELWLVDLPGYGYAKVAKTERADWKRWIEAYLGSRRTLRLAVLLQDLRRDPGEDERLLLEWLAEREQLISISPRPFDVPQIDLTAKEFGTIFLYVVAGIPAVALLLGVAVFWLRRN